jgi:hypothetical protein
MPAARGGVGAQRVGQGLSPGKVVEGAGQGQRVEEGHVGALAELGTRAVRGVAQNREARGVGAAQRPVAVASHGQAVGMVDLAEEGRHLGPERGGLVGPGPEAAGAPSVVRVRAERPEDGGLGDGLPGRRPMGRTPSIRSARR